MNPVLAAALALDPAAKERTDAARPTVEVSPESLHAVLKELRANPIFSCDLLLSHAAVDRIEEGQFELFYLLMNCEEQTELWIATRIPRDNPVVDSASDIWAVAEFQEREVYDLFGVLYRNHPDLRRLFLEEDWEGFPLRKDYVDDFMLEKPLNEKQMK